LLQNEQTFIKMNIAIVGLGLIGGSMAIDLKARGFASHIVGVDNSKLNSATALNIGLVDEICTLEEAMTKVELVIVAVPVSAAAKVVTQVLDLSNDNQVVIDTCSTKEKICLSLKNHQYRNRYVATHPMAGTEYSGPWAAKSGLYDSKVVVICDSEDSGPKAVDLVKKMYDTLCMRVVLMNSANHDVHTAYISHISHVCSFALALTVLDKEKDEKHIFDLASSGFDTTVRLAKSSVDMWLPIIEQNKDNILTVLDTYMEKLQAFRTSIQNGDSDTTRKLISEANTIRRVIK